MRVAIILVSLLLAVPLFAQENSNIAVKSVETSNGVLIVTALKTPMAAGEQLTEPGKKTVELQCNKETSSCIALKPGNYLMVKLPPNRGMYDCVDVQVFASNDDPAKGKKIGEYCLTEK